ncbi:MAG TPA: hypothetical protein VHK91_15980 [Flavisolibacter sp.]|jgi:hypothetical protein|nr:hypothetical protein [Flavisolibacter sp.]
MEGSKIRLSPSEMDLVTDASVILTKNNIIRKATALLQEVQEAVYQPSPIQAALRKQPKISKGENYLGLPYVVLDYPRLSEGTDLFFIRSFFWWGNFFSSTLQVSGSWKDRSLAPIAAAYTNLAAADYYVGCHADPWQHHFEEGNYRKIGGLSEGAFHTVLEEQVHIKIAARWPLEEWNLAANRLVESWNLLLDLIP